MAQLNNPLRKWLILSAKLLIVALVIWWIVATFRDAFAELAEKALADMIASGIDTDEVVLRHSIDMRYQGQMNEVSLPWPQGRLEAGDVPALRHAFEAFYLQRFGAGTIRAETPLELISFRVEALKPTAAPPPTRLSGNGAGQQSPGGRRRVYSRGSGWLDAAVYRLDALSPDCEFAGPALIEADSTTVWLPPDATARLDGYGDIDIRPGG